MSKGKIFAKEYEDFLIKGSEDVCNSLPNGSLEKEYFIIIRQLVKEEYSQELDKKINSFIHNFNLNEEQLTRLKALLIYKKMQKNQDKKEEIIKDIKDLFNLGNVKNFSKPFKYNKITKDENGIEEKKIPNKLNLEEYVKVYQLVEDIYSGKIIPYDDNLIEIFGNSNLKYKLDLNKIPVDTIVHMFLEPIEFNKIEIDEKIPINNDLLEKLITLLDAECRKDNKKEKRVKEKIVEFCEKGLIENVESILKYETFNYEDLYEILINKMYSKIDMTNKEEAVKELKKIKNILGKYKKAEVYIKYILLNILQLNAKRNFFELDIFIDYIKLPLTENKYIYNLSEESEKKIDDYWNILKESNLENLFIYDEKEIIEKHLKHFYLKEKIEFNKFNKYFDEDYIKNFYAKMQFYLGSEIPANDYILRRDEIDDLMKEIILNICDHNKDRYNINDDIELILEIKNIQSLYINIYEINTENYYYQNQKEFDTNLSLDGIIPTFEDKLTFNEKPQILLEKKISLTKIPKKRGLFVVEFIGNGHVSRAVIQRGNLKCIHKNTVNGKVLYILDEDNKILKGDQTGLWINNVWFPSFKDSGAILIPYSTKGNKIILKYKDFCCLGEDINIPREEYKLDGEFIINEESFIIGNVTKILVKAYLYVCDEICPLENLKDVKIYVGALKIENNQEIPSVNIIDNVILSYDKEFCFDFQVPPKLKIVEIQLKAKIRNKSLNEDNNLSFFKIFEFTRNYEYDTLIKKNDEGNYLIHYLGKNGEPKPNHSIGLKITHSLQSHINNDNQILLETNSEGIIDLGKLKDVDSINLDEETINLGQIPKYSYNYSIIILEEEEEINIPFKSLEKDKIYLIQSLDKKNLTNLIKIKITDEKNKLSNATLPKLKKGKYDLIINDLIFSIKVIKGNKMNINNYIVTDDENILYYNKAEPPIYIENVEYKNKELKIKLNKTGKNPQHPRIHISCVQYLPKILNRNVMNFSKNNYFKTINKEIIFKSKKYKNCYLNNKILSDELQYVLDRKQCKVILGNSLENPSLLLKPQFIRETATEIQKGKEGTEFRKRDFEGGVLAYKMARRIYSGDRGDSFDNDDIKIHDFINISPYMKENLIPDENGFILIKDLNLDEYSFLHILCFDNISCNEDWFYLKNGKTSLRDLRAINEFDLNKNYCEFRKLYPLSKKDKHHINDITCTKYKIFDSLEKYLEFIKIVNPSLDDDIDNFQFLLNFNNLNFQEKLEKISAYFSHEINIYLYFHHYDFFIRYIFPIIKYKSEKTFIDYFLLNDTKKIKEYTNPQNISKLNIFEKCLLIYSIKNENKFLANSMARQIRAQCPKDNASELKRLFNIAINLKSIDDEIEEEKQSEEEEGSYSEHDEDLGNDSDSDSDRKCKKTYDSKPKRIEKLKKRDSEDSDDDDEKLDGGVFDINSKEAERIIRKAQIFKEEGKSNEFCETHYYNKVHKENDYIDIISYNHFFADLAQFWSQNDSERNIGFKSDNILIKPKNLTELIFMLSVLDLEEKTISKSQHLIKDKGLGLTIEMNTNAYLLTKEINETQLNTDNKYALILAQMVFEDDKKNKNEEKEPTKFLTNRTYIQKTIVTNISSENINCEILMQIPEGSIPVDSDEYKIIETADIKSYKSEIYEQKFYFPQEGIFKQYPASASINDLVVAKSGLKTFEVVSKIQLNKNDVSNIDDVLNQGNKNEILEFINKRDVIKEDDLEKIYWMLKDKDFYNKLIAILKNKYLFNENIWEYSSENGDIDSLQEFILNNNNKEKLNSIGHEFDLLFIKLDKTNNSHILNHLDYFPILKNRIFKLPKSKSILTTQLKNTYQDYVSYLITLSEIKDYEYMRLCYYLILQQRIKEATIIYNKLNKINIIGNNLTSLELQYDYLTAYLDFSNGFPKFDKTREIAEKYKDISISNWKNIFNEIEDQLNEYDGKINFDEEINKEQKELSKKDKHKIESEEALNVEIKDQIINIIYKNISEIKIKYYLIDIEILFSRSPFVKETKIDFGFIKPQKIDIIKLSKKHNEDKYILKIPEELKNKNFYIEIFTGKIKEKRIYYSSLLKYSLIESIGEIKAMTPDLKPIPKIYVKCFCETNSGIIKFYKDGFTDLRGKFDYISLNSDLINEVKQFSILMVSKEYGSINVICNPPKMIKTDAGKDSIQRIFDYRQQERDKLKKIK